MKAETHSLHSTFSYPVGSSGASASSHGSYFMPGSVSHYLFLDFEHVSHSAAQTVSAGLKFMVFLLVQPPKGSH